MRQKVPNSHWYRLTFWVAGNDQALSKTEHFRDLIYLYVFKIEKKVKRKKETKEYIGEWGVIMFDCFTDNIIISNNVSIMTKKNIFGDTYSGIQGGVQRRTLQRRWLQGATCEAAPQVCPRPWTRGSGPLQFYCPIVISHLSRIFRRHTAPR